MKTAEQIILRPVITEASTEDAMLGRYTFEVAVDATKPEIRQACEKLFQVKVLKVNTQNLEGKLKRVGQHLGRRKSWKKAIVTIDLDPKATSYLAKGGEKKTINRKYKTEIEEFGLSL
ncbi:MAG: 50S ribosomal protein L23 [Eubacteriales bacterium]|nr:50S ribosomal protein L23 [Eubacteriales bacterium]